MSVRLSQTEKLQDRRPRTALPVYMLDAVKARANAMGVPYQALIKEAVIRADVRPETSESGKG
jgi:predicted DNA binding CopG/RHH family protein